MELDTLVTVDSSFCISYYMDSFLHIIFIKYHNGSVYMHPFSLENISAWTHHYTINGSVGKAFWKVLENGKGVLISKG